MKERNEKNMIDGVNLRHFDLSVVGMGSLPQIGMKFESGSPIHQQVRLAK